MVSYCTIYTEDSRAPSLAEGYEQKLRFPGKIYRIMKIYTAATANLHVRFESAANQQDIPADQYRQYLRELNDQRRSIVLFHRNWCKKAVIALKEGKSVEPYRIFLKWSRQIPSDQVNPL